MSDAATIITASVGVLSAVGATGRFIWNKIEKRFEKIEKDLVNCQSREVVAGQRAAVKLTVIELLWQEVDRLTPTKPNPTLRRVKTLLDTLKLPEPSPELDDLVSLIRSQGEVI